MKAWFSRNAASIEAAAAAITACVAVVALIGVKVQLDAADNLQRSQSARDAYRSHLVLATTQPRFARPDDGCNLLAGDEAGAYVAFVDHLLYSAEQMLDTEPGWETTFTDALQPHSAYMCSAEAPAGSTPEMADFLTQFKETSCAGSVPCQ